MKKKRIVVLKQAWVVSIMLSDLRRDLREVDKKIIRLQRQTISSRKDVKIRLLKKIRRLRREAAEHSKGVWEELIKNKYIKFVVEK